MSPHVQFILYGIILFCMALQCIQTQLIYIRRETSEQRLKTLWSKIKIENQDQDHTLCDLEIQ